MRRSDRNARHARLHIGDQPFGIRGRPPTSDACPFRPRASENAVGLDVRSIMGKNDRRWRCGVPHDTVADDSPRAPTANIFIGETGATKRTSKGNLARPFQSTDDDRPQLFGASAAPELTRFVSPPTSGRLIVEPRAREEVAAIDLDGFAGTRDGNVGRGFNGGWRGTFGRTPSTRQEETSERRNRHPLETETHLNP